MIVAERLGKQYQLGDNTPGYGRLTDSLSRALRRRGDEPAASRELWALRDVSFEIERGQVVGLIGRNGAGKSTLLKILARVTVPTEGRATIAGRVGSLLEVGTGFHQELTGRENVFLSGAILGMRRAEIQRKFDEIVEFAEVQRFIDTPVKRYSSGMGLRLGFAVAAFLEPEVLLVDEVLAVGDRRFREKCMGRIGEVSRDDGRTVVFVSHDLNAVLSTCSRALLVDSGRLIEDGAVDQVVARYEREQSERAPTGGVFERTTPNPHMAQRLLLEAQISSAAGEGHAAHGEPLAFVFRTAADFPAREFGVEVRIVDRRQRPVAFMSSLEMAGRYFAPGDVIRCEIGSLALAPGSYRVDVNASIPYVQGMDAWSGEIGFDVVRFDPFDNGSTFSPDDRTGSVVPAHEWSTG